MQKELIRLLFLRDKITDISIRLILLVIFMLIPVSQVLAENHPGILNLISDPASITEEFQQGTVTGTVTDLKGEPIIGATVVVKGTTMGALTDASGNFTIPNVPSDAILSFSFIGMTPQEIPLNGQTKMNVVLQEAVQALDEVVVVGYGMQKKQSVVGSITQTTGDDILKNVSGSDLSNALSGNIPGVTVIQNSGIPGGFGQEQDVTQIFIRGQKTWNNSAPLILVDGIERDMSQVDPYTIESISVLKDASSTAVFGVKGANGVILVTTQRGKEGKPKMSFNGTMSAKSVSRIPEQLDSYETLKIRNYVLVNELSISPSNWDYMTPELWLDYYRDQTYPDYLVNTNWVKESTKSFAIDQQANMSVAGGTKNVKYFGSFSYLHENDILRIKDYGQGYVPNYEYNRFNFRSNLDFDITPTTRFSTSLAGFMGVQQSPPNAGSSNYALYGAPVDAYPMIYSDGTWGDWQVDERFKNLVVEANFNGSRTRKTSQVNTDFELNQKLDFLTKGLEANAKLSYDINANTVGPNINDDGILTKYIPSTIMEEIAPGMTDEQIKALEEKYTIWNMPRNYVGSTGYDYVDEPNINTTESVQTNVFRSLNYQISLKYSREFGKHTFGGLLLMSRNERATGSEFASYREDWVGRVTYNYDMRYLFEFNGAYNGSEKFARKYRFGFFPSMAVGWVVSNERFFTKYTSIVNNLKLRFSNGRVGSDAGVARWLYTGSYNVTSSTWQFGAPYAQSSYPIIKEGIIPNPDIQWETSDKTDFGIETGFFKNLITINFDYFWENRTNIFISGTDRSVPEYFGAPAVSANLGQVKNKGWELESEFSKTTPGGFNYWAALAWSFVKDEIIERADPELRPSYQKQAGYAIGQPRNSLNQALINSWNDVYTGVLGESNETLLPGDFHLVDFNSDGVVNSEDNAPYGFTNRPQYSYTPRIGMEYKGLSASLVFYGVYNVEGESNYGPLTTPFWNSRSILWPASRDLSWCPELGITTNATYPGMRFATKDNSGSIYQSRAAFRLQHAEIAYILSSQFVKKMGISNLRFLLSGDNLFLLSDMFVDFDDTEENRNYPRLKRYNFGVSFNF